MPPKAKAKRSARDEMENDATKKVKTMLEQAGTTVKDLKTISSTITKLEEEKAALHKILVEKDKEIKAIGENREVYLEWWCEERQVTRKFKKEIETKDKTIADQGKLLGTYRKIKELIKDDQNEN